MKKLLVVLSMVILAGCYNDNEQDLYPQPNPTPNPNPGTGDTISYSSQIKPIIDSKCATAACHDANGLGGGYNFSTYAGLKSAVDAGRLLGAINHESGFFPMPKGLPKLDQASIDLFTKWVNQGAPNN